MQISSTSILFNQFHTPSTSVWLSSLSTKVVTRYNLSYGWKRQESVKKIGNARIREATQDWKFAESCNCFDTFWNLFNTENEKKVSKVTRNKQHKQHKRRRKREKKIETFYRHDYQLNRLKSHSQSPVCVLNKNETQHKMYAHLI